MEYQKYLLVLKECHMVGLGPLMKDSRNISTSLPQDVETRPPYFGLCVHWLSPLGWFPK